MITRVAILISNGTLYVGKEKDRHDALYRTHRKEILLGQRVQGFLTDAGEFLDRRDAAKHAFECGQIADPENDYLLSEDVW